MTIFSRYVFRQTSGALLLVLLSLTGIVWISLALRELNVVTSQGQSAITLVQMTTLGLPGFVAVITPFALLITVIHTLNRLNSDSEIIVLTASGATAWTITKPLAVLAAVIMVFLTFVNHIAMPWSLRMLREMVIEVRADLLTQVVQPGRFSSPERNLTVHVRERGLDGTLHGLVMHDAREEKEVRSYLAERGVIVENDGDAYLFMMDGHILRREGGINQPSQIIVFDKYAVDLDRFEERTAGEQDLRPRERYMSELLYPDKNSKIYQEDAGRFVSELHERFAGALYPLAFVLMAVAGVGQAQSTRTNRHAMIGLTFLAGVGLRLAGLAMNNVVVLYPALFPIMYLIPVAGVVVSMVLIVRGTRSSRSSVLVDRLVDRTSQIGAQLRQRFRRGGAAATARG